MGLPSVTQLQSLNESQQSEALDALFEPSPAIHKTLIPLMSTGEYSSWPEYIDACHNSLRSLAAASSTDATLLEILGSHPRLGEKKITSAQSAAEQANLQGEGEELARLNKEYEEKFPGLRYVVFVNGRGRPQIMENMRTRIARGDYELEVDAAIQAMCDIAKDRAAKLTAA